MNAGRWTDLVERIRSGQKAAEEELYLRVIKWGRWYVNGLFLGAEELTDVLHDAYLAILEAIRRADGLKQAECLGGLMRVIVRRKAARLIEQKMVFRRRHEELSVEILDRQPDPEKLAMAAEEWRLMGAVLIAMQPRDRELLVRCFVVGQEADQVRMEMHLTKTQYRLLKSRAKAKAGAAGRQLLEAA